MPKKIDARWSSPIGQKQLKAWEENQKKSANDSVNNPPHYQKGGMETIDIMQNLLPLDEFMGYLKGCIIKYISRYEYKEKPLEDLAKAEWYIKKLKDIRTKHDAYINLEKHLP